MEKRIKELIDKEFLSLEELEELLESDNVIFWQNNGNSGEHNGYTWYSVTTKNEEFDVYLV